MDVHWLDGNGLFKNFSLKVLQTRFVLEDGVDGEVEFWEGVYVDEGVGVDGLDGVKDRETDE